MAGRPKLSRVLRPRVPGSLKHIDCRSASGRVVFKGLGPPGPKMGQTIKEVHHGHVLSAFIPRAGCASGGAGRYSVNGALVASTGRFGAGLWRVSLAGAGLGAFVHWVGG